MTSNKIHTLLLFLLLHAELFSQSRLVINNGGYIVMSGGTSVTPIYLGVENSAINAITRITSGHIISEGEYNRVQWNTRTTIGTFTFPIGKSTTDYLPFVFDKTTAGTESGIGTVRFASWFTAANAVLPSATTSLCGIATENDVIDRFWVIDVLNYSANPTATVRFGYKDPGDLDAIPEADLRAQRWNSAMVPACKWANPSSGTVNTVSDYVEVAGISNFSPWTLTRVSAPLPIELLEFTAQWKEKEQTSVLLQWKTASEFNNDYFTIEREVRNEGQVTSEIHWMEIGKVKGAGNSSTILYYDFIDASPFPFAMDVDGLVYYRLKQMDYNGSFTYSNIQLLGKRFNSRKIISVFPNPSNSYFDCLISSSEDASVAILVIDAIGKVVVSQKEEIKKGMNTRRINISYLSCGNYILQITTGNDTKTEKQLVIH